jgi:methyl-galactoside transport system substrate-binding protein
MKKLLSMLLTVLLMVSMVSCGSKSTSEGGASDQTEKKPVIGVAIFDYSNNYVTYIRNAINVLAGDKADIQMVDAQNDQTKQTEQIDLLLSKGVDVLCVNAVDPKAAATIISKAKAASVHIVFFNRCPSADDMNSYDKCWYVGTTPQDSGRMQAEMAMEAFKADPSFDKNKDGSLQYVMPSVMLMW